MRYSKFLCALLCMAILAWSPNALAVGFSQRDGRAIQLVENTTLTPAGMRGQVYYVTGSITIILPPAAQCSDSAGATFQSVDGGMITLLPNGADRVRAGGVVLGDGVGIVNEGFSGDTVTIHMDSGPGWSTIGMTGYWGAAE